MNRKICRAMLCTFGDQMVTTWWIHQEHLNAAKKLRHQQSFTSLFAWARKSCANDRKAQKILACNDGEKKRPPPHIHIKWPLWMYCVQYTLIFLYKRCNLTKERNISKHEKHIQHLFRVSRHIGPWHNQHCTALCAFCKVRWRCIFLWRCIWYNKKKGWKQGHIHGRRGGYSGIFWGKSRI